MARSTVSEESVFGDVFVTGSPVAVGWSVGRVGVDFGCSRPTPCDDVRVCTGAWS
jgi:hypothetical protein